MLEISDKSATECLIFFRFKYIKTGRIYLVFDGKMSADQIQYSEKYYDDTYEYR